MDQALGTEGVKFDARTFNWIGSPVEDNNVFWGWHTNPVKTIEQDGRTQIPTIAIALKPVPMPRSSISGPIIF